MKLNIGKLSNYIGQAKDNKQLDSHLVAIDRDLQNIWRIINQIAPYIGTDSTQLATNTAEGFSYIPSMYDNPQTSPTNYTGHVAIVFCNSDSSLRVYNTSDTSWKLELLT